MRVVHSGCFLKLYRDALEISIHEIVTFELYDVMGKKQLSKQLNSINEHQLFIPTAQPGIYFYRLVKGDKAVESGKLIIE